MLPSYQGSGGQGMMGWSGSMNPYGMMPPNAQYGSYGQGGHQQYQGGYRNAPGHRHQRGGGPNPRGGYQRRPPRPDAANLLCCYFLQGKCKFSTGCRYSHVDNGQACHFGTNCRLQHHARSKQGQPEASAAAAKPESQQPEKKEEESAEAPHQPSTESPEAPTA